MREFKTVDFGGPKRLPWVPDIKSNIKARTTAVLY